MCGGVAMRARRFIEVSAVYTSVETCFILAWGDNERLCDASSNFYGKSLPPNLFVIVYPWIIVYFGVRHVTTTYTSIFRTQKKYSIIEVFFKFNSMVSESWKEVKCQIKLSILCQTLLKQFLSLSGSYELDFLPEGCSGKRLGPVQSPNRWKISPGRFWTIVNLSSCILYN